MEVVACYRSATRAPRLPCRRPRPPVLRKRRSRGRTSPPTNLPVREFVRIAREGGVIDGCLRHATLSVIPTLDEWPHDVQLHLHSNSNALEWCFGPGSDQVAPVHLKQYPDGRYAAGHCGDAASPHWIDCGDHADSLFEAVLVGLRQQHPWLHTRFTQALMHGRTGAGPMRNGFANA